MTHALSPIPSDAEVQLFMDMFARKAPGAVVLLGASLGPLAPLVASLTEDGQDLHVVDPFRWSSDHEAAALGSPWTERFAVGESYWPAFVELLGDGANRVAALRVDPASAKWTGDAIGALAIDFPLTPRGAAAVVNEFMSRLAVGGVVAVHGIGDAQEPFLAIALGAVNECWEVISVADGESALFRVVQPVPADAVSLNSLLDPVNQKESLLRLAAVPGLPSNWLDDAFAAARAQAGQSPALANHSRSRVATGLGSEWDVAIECPAPPLKSGQRCDVTLKARADRARSLRIVVNQGREPFNSLGLGELVDLTPAWNQILRSFVVSRSDDSPMIRLNIAHSRIPVEVSSISLRTSDETIELTPEHFEVVIRGDWRIEKSTTDEGALRATLDQSKALRSGVFGIGMTTAGERLAVRDYAALDYTGVGQIVDLGVWLGSTVIPFAQGMMENHRPAVKKRKIHAYDRFIYESWMDSCLPSGEHVGRYRPGDNFVAEFLERTKTWDRLIEARPADLTQVAWDGGPIEVLFVDAMKSWDLANAIFRNYFPHVIPGGWVFHQDFAHHSTPWIHLIMHRLRDRFEFVRHVAGSGTVIFRLVQPIREEDVVAGFSFASFADEERLAALHYARSLVDAELWRNLDASHALLLALANRVAEARDAFERVFSPDADVPPEFRYIPEQIAANEAMQSILRCPFPAVQAGGQWSIRFRARADAPRQIVISVLQGHEPWHGLGVFEYVSLDQQWRDYRVDFAASADDEKVAMQVSIGTSKVGFELADIRFEGLATGVTRPGDSDWVAYSSPEAPVRHGPVDGMSDSLRIEFEKLAAVS